MNKPDKCFKCQKEFDWNDEVWSISEVKKYKVKIHTCKCGQAMSTAVPVDKDEIAWWNKMIRGW